MTKKILIIDANPCRFSYTSSLAEEYMIAAEKTGFPVKMLVLRDIKFDPILHVGYRKKQELEPDLVEAQELISWCDHLVIVTPVWWYGMPALLKGFFDRVFLPGYAFEVAKGIRRGKVSRLMKGKTATAIYTYGAGKDNMQGFISKDSLGIQLKNGILSFCGFEDIKIFPFYNTLGFYNMGKRRKFLDKVGEFGSKGI